MGPLKKMFSTILGISFFSNFFFQNDMKDIINHINICVAVKRDRDNNEQRNGISNRMWEMFKGPPLYCLKFKHGKILSNSRLFLEL